MTNNPPPASIARPHWTSLLKAGRMAIGRHPQVLLASDFDGTLSPIVERPEEAVLVDSIRSLLDGFQKLHPRVSLMLVSGRSLSDLSARVPLADAILAGNHGLEIRENGETWIHPEVKAARPLLEELLHDFDSRFTGIPGIELEDKGLSVTLHYRRMNAQWLPMLNEALDSIVLPDALRRHAGKMVHEFRPAVNWNKGLAVRQIAASLGIPHEAVIFLGDDLTDEDAFRELAPAATSVHVGDAATPSLARFNADSPEDVAGFLEAVMESLKGVAG